jgi:hypothetical protein
MYNLIQDVHMKRIPFLERVHQMINTGENNDFN